MPQRIANFLYLGFARLPEQLFSHSPDNETIPVS